MVFYKVLLKSISLLTLGTFIACTAQTDKKTTPTTKDVVQVKKDNNTQIDTTVTNQIPIAKENNSKNSFDYVTKSYVLGKFDYKKRADFTVIPKQLSLAGIYLRKDVLASFTKMASHAKKDGVHLKIISGTRNFAHQKRIWDNKWNNKYKHIDINKRALKILEFSSMPTTSRHHWGTDMDINNLENSYFAKGRGKKEYDWLLKNAKTYGFYQVYTSKKTGRTGYNEEKWHWSYAPISSVYLEFYNKHISNKDIVGFKGCEYATSIDMVKNYVNGINPEILNFIKKTK